MQGANFCQLKQWLCSLRARSCRVASCSLSSLLIRPWKVSMISCGNKAPVVGQKQCWLEAWGGCTRAGTAWKSEQGQCV